MIHSLAQDIRYGLRMLVKNPGFTMVAVITLALGIGVNTAIFSIVDSLLLRPLPVKDPSALVTFGIQLKNATVPGQFSYPDYLDLRNQTTEVFSDVITYEAGLDGVVVNGKPERIMTNYVSANYFTSLGIAPALGRFILPSEGNTPGADPVLVLSYSYWQSRFGGDLNVIGQKVSFNGHPVTIVGVAPKDFHGLYTLLDFQGYLPFGMATLEGNPPDFMTSRGQRILQVILARLKPGVTLDQGRAAVQVVARRLAQEYPALKDATFQVYPERLARPQPGLGSQIATLAGLFLVLSALVLLLACVNVANILLVRAAARGREIAIRAALGAARMRLVAQMLTESVVLGGVGGIAGVLLGIWASHGVASINLRSELPVLLDFHFDWRVFAFAFGAALLTGIVVGVVPAIRSSRSNIIEALREGGRTVAGGRHKLRSALVVAQVAGSLMLLIVAGLFTRSLRQAQRLDLGFDPSNILNLHMDPNEVGYNEAQGRTFYKNLLARLRSLPGVQSATVALDVPMGYYNSFDSVEVPGYQPRPDEPSPIIRYSQISSDYFQTMRIPIVAGRVIQDSDDQNTPFVAVINQAMADQFWPHQNPLGREFKMGSDAAHTYRVVGVAANARYVAPVGPVRPLFYISYLQNYSSLETIQVRTAGAPQSYRRPVEELIESLAPGLPVFDVGTMADGLETLNGFLIFKFGAGLAGTLGMLGLILAIVGVYGVISYNASQRTHEIGIRMALGANRGDILTMVLKTGVPIVGVGVVIGLGGAFAIAHQVGNFLVAVSARDPLVFGAVTLALALVALAACYIPARRAMRVDPMVALRYE